MKKNITKLNPKYFLFVVFLSILSYIFQFFNLSNIYLIVVSVLFVFLIFYNRNEKTIDIVIYFILWSIITMPSLIIDSDKSIGLLLIYFGFNLIIYLLIAIGLIKNKAWGFYLAIIIFILAAISSLITLFIFTSTISGFDINIVIVFTKQILLISVLILSITYLVKFKSFFIEEKN